MLGINWLELMLGSMAGLVAAVIFDEPLRRLKQRLLGFMNNDRFEKRDPEFLQIGGRLTNVLVIDGDGRMEYKRDSLSVTLAEMPNLSAVLAARTAALQKEIEARRLVDPSGPWNGKQYGIAHVRTSRADNERTLAATIGLFETDYAHFLATVAELGKESMSSPPKGGLRETYLREGVSAAVIPEIAVGFGVAILICTSDNYLIFSRRSNSSAVRPGEIDVSVVEGISPDFDRSGAAADPFRAAARGIEEELGLRVTPDQIHILGLAVDSQFYQWNLVAFVDARVSVDELKAAKGSGSTGAWETERIVAVKNSVPGVLEFLCKSQAWGFTWLCAYWALVRTHSKDQVDKFARQILP